MKLQDVTDEELVRWLAEEEASTGNHAHAVHCITHEMFRRRGPSMCEPKLDKDHAIQKARLRVLTKTIARICRQLRKVEERVRRLERE